MEQDRIAAAAERERLAEIKRLEQEAAGQAAEAKKKADAAAAAAAPTDLDDDGPAPEAPKTVIEQKIEALRYVPAAAPTKIKGSRSVFVSWRTCSTSRNCPTPSLSGPQTRS